MHHAPRFTKIIQGVSSNKNFIVLDVLSENFEYSVYFFVMKT